MLRVLLGFLKGGLVGAALGVGASELGLGGSGSGWLLYGLVGCLVGVVCGRPVWRQETLWTPCLKGVVGFVVCLGLYFGLGKLLGDARLPFATGLWAPDEPLVKQPMLLAPMLGIAYGIFVELDDGKRNPPAPGPGGANP